MYEKLTSTLNLEHSPSISSIVLTDN